MGDDIRYKDQVYEADGTTVLRTPSPPIWYDCPVRAINEDPSLGNHHFDDFRWGIDTGATQNSSGPYMIYGDTGVTMLQEAAAQSTGVVEIAGNDADNDEGVISTGPMAIISDTAGNGRKVAFEARVNKASIADNACGMFVGLAYDAGSHATVAQTLCLTDDDAALGAFSYIGFHVDQANGDAWDFVYKAEGQAQTVLIAGIQVPVASTWYKFGFRFDPLAPTAKRIAVYVDGVANATYVTGTLIAAALFPDEEALAMVFCAKVGAAAESKARMDWWKGAMWGDIEV